jgi:predicted regulator of Ras-like GTPase activity (Roadblock/LC7/MglB family)
MNERQIDELLNYLSRITAAVESLAHAGNEQFRPDHSRAIRLRGRKGETLPHDKQSEV